MNFALILKIAGIGLLISVINTLLEKADKKDMTSFTTLAGVIIVLTMLLTEINNLFNTVRTMFQLW